MTPNTTFDRTIFDAIPTATFVVDDDVQIQKLNGAAALFCGQDERTVYKKRGGDILQCLHATDVPEGCGRGPACRNCIIRNSVATCLAGQTVSRKRMNLHVKQGSSLKDLALLITTSPLPSSNGQSLVLLMVEDISEVTTLRSIIPICMKCKKIRDDQQYWKSVDDYFHEHAGVDFTHSLCPECVCEVYPEAFPVIPKSRS
jgi:hypothetical protein